MRVGAVIAAAGKSGGYKSYDKMKSVDGIQVLRQMILNFKRAGVDEIVLITGYQAEQVEKKLEEVKKRFRKKTSSRQPSVTADDIAEVVGAHGAGADNGNADGVELRHFDSLILVAVECGKGAVPLPHR